MNIFVAKLSGATTADGLKRLFEQFGEVSDVKIIIDRETNMSKGYGFVEMPNVAEGHTAIAELNEAEVDGSIIVVKESQPRTGEKSGFSGGGNRGGNRSFGGGNKFKKPGFGGGRSFDKKPGFGRSGDRDHRKGGYHSREDRNSY